MKDNNFHPIRAKVLSSHRFLRLSNVPFLFIYKRASLACAVRLADILCPPEAPFGLLYSPSINYRRDNTFKIRLSNCYDRYRTKNHF